MATLGSDKLTGVTDVANNNSAVSKRYVETIIPSPGGVSNSYLLADRESYTVWNMRTVNSVPATDSPNQFYLRGFVYSEKDNIYLANYYYTSNRPPNVTASTDAIHWALRTVPAPSNEIIYNLDYPNDTYFAYYASIMTVSTDSIHWTLRTTGITNPYKPGSYVGSQAIQYDGQQYIFSPVSAIAVSTDTIHWETRTKPGGGVSDYYNYGSLYYNGIHYVVGGNASSNQMLIASTDAIAWTFRTVGFADITSIPFHIQYLEEIEKYCILGSKNNYILSTDAIHWEEYTSPAAATTTPLSPFVFDNDFKQKSYLTTVVQQNPSGTSTSALYKSTDAINWTTIADVFYPTGAYNAIKEILIKGENEILMVQDRQVYMSSEFASSNKSFASSTSVSSPKGTALIGYERRYASQTRRIDFPKGISYLYAELVSGGDGGYSGFNSGGLGGESSQLVKKLFRLDPSTDTYILATIGSGGSGHNNYGASLKYKDQNNWTHFGYYPRLLYSGDLYTSISGYTASGDEAYLVGMQSGRLMSSIGGINSWQMRTASSNAYYYNAHYHNNLFVVGGTNSYIGTSTDTIHWTQRTIGAYSQSYDIKYYNNLWHCLHSGGSTYSVSTDAIHWTQRTTGSGTAKYCIGYDSSTNYYMIASSSRTALFSTDTIHWTLRTTSIGSSWTAIASDNNSNWLIAGNYGYISSSTDTIHWKQVDYANEIGLSEEGYVNNSSAAPPYGHHMIYAEGSFYLPYKDYPDYQNQRSYLLKTTDTIHWSKENHGNNPKGGAASEINDIYYSSDMGTFLVSNKNGGQTGQTTSLAVYNNGTSSISAINNHTGKSVYADYGTSTVYAAGDNGGFKSTNGDGLDSGPPTISVNEESPHYGFYLMSGAGGAKSIGSGGNVGSRSTYGSSTNVSGGSGTTTTFEISVTNSGTTYYVMSGTDETTTHSSANNPTITVKSGNAVVFDVNASGHPFWIKSNQSTGTDNRLPSFIVDNNGADVGKVIFETVGLSAGTYYYNCENHSSMKGSIVVTSATSSIHGEDGEDGTITGGRFGTGGGGGASYLSEPNFWNVVGTDFPDSNVFGSNAELDKMLYDSNTSQYLYTGVSNDVAKFAVSTDVIHWKLRTVGDSYSSWPSYGHLAIGGGYYVLCGLYDIKASTDTIHWQLRTHIYPTTSIQFRSLVYDTNNSTWLIGASNSLLASTDTIVWVFRTAGYGIDLSAGAHGNGYTYFGTSGFNGPNISSTDTIHWQQRTVTVQYWAYGASFAGVYFFASDNSYNRLSVSTDSIHWELRTTTSGLGNFRGDGVKYGSYQGTNVYMIGSSWEGIHYSTDSIVWLSTNKIDLNIPNTSYAYGNTLTTDGSGNWYVANRNGNSPDGLGTAYYRSFYTIGGDLRYFAGNGGQGGPGCGGGGGANTSKRYGIGGEGGDGYVQVSWW